ncbi:MAG: hypothetical protein PHC86_09120 [Eubacteriales bacterium]|nr:hypothetical protein [Eubacteriales bacterium]
MKQSKIAKALARFFQEHPRFFNIVQIILLSIVLICLLLLIGLNVLDNQPVMQNPQTGSSEQTHLAQTDISSNQTLTAEAQETPLSQPVLRTFQRPPQTLADLKQLIATHHQASGTSGQSLKSEQGTPATQSLADEAWPVAITLQPDPTTNRVFLLVSESEQAALAFNSYFNFYYDWTNPENIFPTLILDRLFSENQRTAALSNETYSSPRIEVELQHWLNVLIDPLQGQNLQGFILDCYRKDFQQRLMAPEDSQLYQVSKQFGELEVTYFADRESYCTFNWL